MLHKSLKIVFRICSIIFALIAVFKLSEGLREGGPGMDTAFWINVALVSLVYVFFIRMSKMFKRLSEKKYFTEETQKLMRETGIYLISIQIVTAIILFRAGLPEYPAADLATSENIIFYYAELILGFGAFLLAGLVLISFSYILKPARELSDKEWSDV